MLGSETNIQSASPAVVEQAQPPGPAKALSIVDALAIVVGVVIGSGIFKSPSMVAATLGSEPLIIGVWFAGGAISLIGALCYAELTTAYPNAGGDYYYLRRGFGDQLAFLFVWSRVTVIQTGTVALTGFIIGDYLTQILRIGPYSSSIYAALAVMALTMLNIGGIRPGKWTQNLLTGGIVVGLLLVVGVGLVAAGVSATPGDVAVQASTGGASAQALGLAMIFVLYTYGGWNEAAYISAEVHNGGAKRKNMVRVLVIGIALITAVYLLANIAFLRGLGVAGVARSEAVAADLMRASFGAPGVVFISVLVTVAALSTMNATIITGARTAYALGRDFPMFGFLGRWKFDAGTPVNALILQGGISLALVLYAALLMGPQPQNGYGGGFEKMVSYTAPVFWFFFMLVSIALIVLRFRDPGAVRPFRVPLFPLTPLFFSLVCLYMLWSSLTYAGRWSLLGLAVLLAGVPVLALTMRKSK